MNISSPMFDNRRESKAPLHKLPDSHMKKELQILSQWQDEVPENQEEDRRDEIGGPLEGGKTPDILKYASQQANMDNIDELAGTKNEEGERSLGLLKEKIKYWTKPRRYQRPVSPPNDMARLLSLASVDERKRQERIAQRSERSKYMTIKGMEKQLNSIKLRYNIPLPQEQLSDNQLLQQLVDNDNNSYYAYK